MKAVKPGATVLAEFVDAGDQNTAKMHPYFVVSQSGSGRAGWLGSGETYRLRAADANYFDRFWLKLTRYLSAKREAKAARGRILLNKDFVSGGPIRMMARVLQPSGRSLRRERDQSEVPHHPLQRQQRAFGRPHRSRQETAAATAGAIRIEAAERGRKV